MTDKRSKEPKKIPFSTYLTEVNYNWLWRQANKKRPFRSMVEVLNGLLNKARREQILRKV